MGVVLGAYGDSANMRPTLHNFDGYVTNGRWTRREPDSPMPRMWLLSSHIDASGGNLVARDADESGSFGLIAATLAGLAVVWVALGRTPRGVDPPVKPLPSAELAAPTSDIPDSPKLLLEHKLQVRRIIYDKFLIGLLLLAAGFLVNQRIEDYKASAVRAQYLLDKRLLAATEIRKSLTDVVTPLFVITQRACAGEKVEPEHPASARKALEHFAATLNSSTLLVKEDYMADAERVVSIFYGVVAHKCYADCSVRTFIDHVSQYVTDETREQVMAGGDASVIAPRGKSFKPLAWSNHDLQTKGNKAYMEMNFEEWRKSEGPAKPVAVCRGET